ncbi:MAG: inositol monophosphatase [Betaproteobacteria bacterium]|nr:inositol monophosphatase [Betaproteobacteria bacterium]
MSSTLHPMLNVAIKAARAAGAIINRAALDVEAVRVSQKQVNDFVTEIDQASERIIIETLLTAYPDHGILAEESGSQHGNPNADHIWIIDPLDGTTNFIHGFPVYCVSIALQVRGKLEQAVIYDPTRNDLFTATKGRGAFMNERRIRVSKRTRLNECLISTGFPFRPEDDFNKYLRLMGDVMQRTAGLRRPGAAALDLAYVAAGFSDGFFELGLQPWDMAAGALLVTEAGGLVGNFTGDANYLEHKECMAASPRIYAQLVPLLHKYSKFASADEKREVTEATKTLSLSLSHDNDAAPL